MVKVITKYWLVQMRDQYSLTKWMAKLQYEYQDNNYKIIPRTKHYEARFFPIKKKLKIS